MYTNSEEMYMSKPSSNPEGFLPSTDTLDKGVNQSNLSSAMGK